MDLRQADDDAADAIVAGRAHHLLGVAARCASDAHLAGAVVLGRRLARLAGERHSGGEHERLAAAGKRAGHRLHRGAVDQDVLLELVELVDEGEVDHAVGLPRQLGQCLRIVEVAQHRLSSRPADAIGALGIAGEAGDAVAGGDQLGHHRGADEARGSGDENVHGDLLYPVARRYLGRRWRGDQPRGHTGMATNSLSISDSLGGFLRDRRERLAAPAGATRRRTPGLRREEVATRAGVSLTWYTWLEQGRGGAPSAEVLDRLSAALELDDDGRELLFLLAQHRPPPLAPTGLAPTAVAEVTPSLQRVLDALPLSPAIVKTPVWDVVAWNVAATRVLADYRQYPRGSFNILRKLVCDREHRANLPDWEATVRFAVATMRIDVARVGGLPEADALVADLSAADADFARLWAETDGRSHGMASKRIVHPQVGLLHLESHAFPVSGAGGLTMIVFNPAGDEDRARVARLVAG